MRMVVLAATIATDGLWLIGLGAFVVVLVALVPRPPRLNLRFGGQDDGRTDRVASAATTTGLLATAAGSVLVAIGSTPSVRFVVTAVAALGLSMWLLLARQVRTLWLVRRSEAAAKLKENQDLTREAWELEATAMLARWRWALSHPLTSSNAYSWPAEYLRRRIGDAPPGIPPEWYSVQGQQLRYNRPSLVRWASDDAPDWPRDIVAVALDAGWFVLGTPRVVAFYTPSGVQHETVVLAQPPLMRPLARMKLLHRLHQLGLPAHHGSRGQALPGHDASDLVRHLVDETQPDLTQVRE